MLAPLEDRDSPRCCWHRPGCLASVAVLLSAGCFDWSSLKSPPTDPGAAGASGATAPVDPFAAAEAETDSAGRPYLAVARPFITAIAERRYEEAFEKLAPSARAQLSRNQFVSPEDDRQRARYNAEPIPNPTAAQFAELMQQTEAAYGVPAQLGDVYVETDPEILSRRDAFGAALELGAMPDSIPVESRMAAVQAWVHCALSDEEVRQLADHEGISEEEVRRNLADYEGPYFKIRTVIVEEGAGPVVGYFEMAPPSIWD